ncbi:MAG: SDR family oxidoreductase [Clostridiales Family XIII bacterium]|jgi:NAD(P)-dependent dehydrogenase (short-subunit alcohol dehydrogenase family)|nr:SDR family oxidoreductase [Clostridiales Family XIII bacterium]
MGYFDLTGRRALILGAGGIGGAIAKGVAEAGAEVVIADANSGNLSKAKAEAESVGGTIHAIHTEIKNRDDVAELYKQVDETLPEIDLSVNSIGLNEYSTALETTEAQWNKVFTGFLDNVFWSNQQAGKRFVAQKRGKIVNIASISGIVVNSGFSYAAAKAGVIQLTRALALEWISSGVFVNSISPGTVYTALTKDFVDVPEVKKDIESGIPIGRIGQPDDIVGTAIYLLSRASDYVVGQNIIVDGGYTVR